MAIDWHKCKGGVWCDLFQLDLEHEFLRNLSGVYIVWSGTTEKSVLKVGSGLISTELKKERSDLAIQIFSHHGVYVSWAEVSALKRESVMLYLAEVLSPKLPVNLPRTIPVKVDLPW
ncbi:MAG: hypothetical protein IAE98_03510 [Candidatus Kapabacteria bacterium]|nr:hypothetical protein [Candidatus Kapabacteria bacterium]